MATLYRRNEIYYVKFILDGAEVRRSLKTRDADKAKEEKEALELILIGAAVETPNHVIPPPFSFSELKERIRKWGFRHTRSETRKIRDYALAKWESFTDLQPIDHLLDVGR